MWLPIWYFASTGSFREAAYFVLFVIYFATAVVFRVGLPRKSLGKVAIVAGFVIWSLVFLLTRGLRTIQVTMLSPMRSGTCRSFW